MLAIAVVNAMAFPFPEEDIKVLVPANPALCTSFILLLVHIRVPFKRKVWVAGATGLVGSRLVSKLSSLGHTVHVLTRNAGKAQSKLSFGKVKTFEPAQWDKAIAGSDAVINLAGRKYLLDHT